MSRPTGAKAKAATGNRGGFFVSARRARRRPIVVGIDTGGTFTDFICLDGTALHVHKRLSTPDDPARAVLQGLRALFGRPARAAGAAPPQARITYGSTVATNAVLERKGARVVLLTTAGFEDVLEIGRQTRPDLYALEPRKPPPLVARRRRLGVAERMAFDGVVLRALSPAAVRAAVAAVQRLGAESVAVCLLHAYANPQHERALGAALRRLGLPVSLSHELLAEYREYERTSTTVLNAYVAPVMRRHLGALRRGVGRAALRVMQSNGGAISIATAGDEAVRTLLSGPAGGVVGAVAAARRNGIQRLITFDMGGTSTDVSLVDGAVRQHTEWHLADLPVKVPAIDIHTVGAGGGSLASRDAGGALQVGPQSAGAEPGPACYGRGTQATVTDADVVLGRLVPEAFLGGGMALKVARAERALAALGTALEISTIAAAEGVVRVVNAGMERAIRRISIERGHDPRHYTLVAFGGAGGLHACELAGSLGMPRVLVPQQPGLLSAWGAIGAEVQRDVVQTVRLIDPAAAELTRRLRPLIARARRAARAESGAGARVRVAVDLDVRYRGQSYEIRLPMRADYRRAFDAAHRRLYGYADRARAVEVVNLRVVGIARGVPPRVPRPVHHPVAAQPHRLRWQGRWVRALRYDRAALPVGRRLRGPLVITELSATTVVPPDWSATVTRHGDVLLTSGVAKAGGGG